MQELMKTHIFLNLQLPAPSITLFLFLLSLYENLWVSPFQVVSRVSFFLTFGIVFRPLKKSSPSSVNLFFYLHGKLLRRDDPYICSCTHSATEGLYVIISV